MKVGATNKKYHQPVQTVANKTHKAIAKTVRKNILKKNVCKFAKGSRASCKSSCSKRAPGRCGGSIFPEAKQAAQHHRK